MRVRSYAHAKKKRQATKATSIFSLAPLRYSGVPTFSPARCLDGDVSDRKVDWLTAKARGVYQKGTWGRRWMVYLALWSGFILTIVAGSLLAAGRKLQHRCVCVCVGARTNKPPERKGRGACVGGWLQGCVETLHGSCYCLVMAVV